MKSSQPKSLAVMAKEISLLIKYGAPADEFANMCEIADKYGADAIALNVFHNFYSYLPDASDDGIIKISRIANQHGAFLFHVSTILSSYLYLATREMAALVGPFENIIADQDILEFFGWQDDADFRKKIGAPAELAEHVPLNESLELCPACGTSDGDIHTFGCPVEICPWCDGQLTNCPCRFTKTGREQFSCDSHLDELLDRLTTKGRIPFAADRHRPSFMKESKD